MDLAMNWANTTSIMNTIRTAFPLQQFKQAIQSLNCKQDKQDCNIRIMCMQRPENVYRNKRLLYGG